MDPSPVQSQVLPFGMLWVLPGRVSLPVQSVLLELVLIDLVLLELARGHGQRKSVCEKHYSGAPNSAAGGSLSAADSVSCRRCSMETVW